MGTATRDFSGADSLSATHTADGLKRDSGTPVSDGEAQDNGRRELGRKGGGRNELYSADNAIMTEGLGL